MCINQYKSAFVGTAILYIYIYEVPSEVGSVYRPHFKRYTVYLEYSVMLKTGCLASF